MADGDPEARRSPATLSDLQTVPCFVESLQKVQVTKTVRLLSRSWLAFVDNNLQLVRITVRELDQQPQTRFPLWRWRNCQSVVLVIHIPRASQDLEALVFRPFAGLTSHARQRITTLFLAVHGYDSEPARVDTVVKQLAFLLPNLRVLGSVHEGVDGVPTDPLLRQLFVESLASLQHLEELSLPSYRLLPYIGSLAGTTIRRLEFTNSSDDRSPLPDSAYEGLARLHGLEQITLDGSSWLLPPVAQGAEFDLGRLLRSLPPSLGSLILTRDNIHLGILLEESRAVVVRATVASSPTWRIEDALSVQQLSQVSQALLASRLLPPGHKLEVLSLEALGVPPGTQLASAPELRPLRDLLGRCMEVRVEQLHVDVRDAVQALDMLSGGVEALALRVPGRSSVWLLPHGRSSRNMARAPGTEWLRRTLADLHALQQQERTRDTDDFWRLLRSLWRETHARHLRWFDELAQQQQQQPRAPLPPKACQQQQLDPEVPKAGEVNPAPPEEPLPSTDEMVNRVLHAMASPPSSGASGSSSGDGSGGNGSDGSSPGSVQPRPTPGLLLLRGPFIAALLQTRGALDAWLKCLWPKIAAAAFAAGRAAGAQRAGRGGEDAPTALPLPDRTKAALVKVRSAAVEAATLEAVAATAAEQPAGFLEATPVYKLPSLVAEPGGARAPATAHVYLPALEKVLQDLLDQWAADAAEGPGGSKAGSSASTSTSSGGGRATTHRSRMGWLLGMAAQLTS